MCANQVPVTSFGPSGALEVEVPLLYAEKPRRGSPQRHIEGVGRTGVEEQSEIPMEQESRGVHA